MPRSAAVILGLVLLLPSVVQADGREGKLRTLIRELGHEKWTKRQEAQTRLLEKGESILRLLEDAGDSEDPELSRRARALRERLDPVVGVFDIVEMKLASDAPGSTPELVTVARGASPSGKPLRMAGRSLDGSAARRFTLTWRTITADARDTYDIEVEEGSATSTTKTLLRRPLGTPTAISLLKAGEEVRYVRNDVVITRERHPFLILLRQRFIRRLAHEQVTADDEDKRDEALLGELLEALVRQAREQSGPKRAAALDILGRLRVHEYADLFAGALDHEDTRTVAALALMELGPDEDRDEVPAHLVSLLGPEKRPLSTTPVLERRVGAGRNSGQGLTTSPGAREEATSQRLRAAALLANTGNSRGLTYLLEKLESLETGDAFAILATISDLRERIAEEDRLRARLLSGCLHTTAITEAPWTLFPLETEHFYLHALEMLDAEKHDDRQLAAAAVRGFENLAAGHGTTAHVRLASVLPLWRRAARIAFAGRRSRQKTKIDRADEIHFLERALEHVNTSVGISVITSRVQSAHAGHPLPTSFLASLFSALERGIASGESGRSSIARRRAFDLSSNLIISAGQLKTVVKGLLATETASSTTARSKPTTTSTAYSLRVELTRWSGVPLAARRTRSNEEAGFATIRAWLTDDERILAREAEILAEQRKRRSKTTRLIYYDFEIRTSPTPRSGDKKAPTGADGAANDNEYEVLSALRAVVRPDVTAVVDDALGLSRDIRVSTPKPRSTTSRVARTSKALRRYRVNGATLVTVGLFQTASNTAVQATQGESWYEVSDVEPRARSIRKSGKSKNQRLILVAAGSTEPALDPSTLPRPGPARVAAVWQRFLDHHLLKPPDSPSAYFRSSFVRVARMLRDPRSVPTLKQLLETHGGSDIAGLLHELGDPAGLEFLKRQLQSKIVTSKIQAARAITDLGDSSGVITLLELAKSNPAEFARQAYSVLQSFERFVTTQEPDDPVRIRVLDFVFAKLAESRYQTTGFRLVTRIAGTDFGYSQIRVPTSRSTSSSTPRSTSSSTSRSAAARSRTAAELRESREKAVVAARAWWQTERARVSRNE